jgi:hypothetical protein
VEDWNLVSFWLGVGALLAMLGQALAGGLIHGVPPPGCGHFDAIFGLGRHDIDRIQFCFAAGVETGRFRVVLSLRT